MSEVDSPPETPAADANTAPAPRHRPKWRLVLAALLVVVLVAILALTRHPRFATLMPQQEDAEISRWQQLEGRIAALEAEVAAIPATPAPPVSGQRDAPQQLTDRVTAMETTAQRLADADAGLSARINALDAHVAAVAGSTTAAGEQARDLLLLALARRFIERGRPLARAETLLEERFGKRDPGAVDALLAWSAAPESRSLLRERLVELARPPATSEAAPAQTGWWQKLRDGLSGLISVRDKAAVGREELERALMAFDEGDIPLAIARLETTSATPRRDAWITAARQFAAALDAVEGLESRILDTVVSAPVVVVPPAKGVPPPVNAPVLVPPAG
ncbi:MAG: hypothetical protein WCZ66_01360 [Sphingomonadaceae bacterium]